METNLLSTINLGSALKRSIVAVRLLSDSDIGNYGNNDCEENGDEEKCDASHLSLLLSCGPN